MTTNNPATSEKEAAVYFSQIFSNNMLPMAIWKYDGTLTSANDAFLELIGYSREDFNSGKVNWRAITPPGYEKEDERCTQELKATGQASPLFKEYLRKDGSRIRVQIANVMHDKTADHGLGIFSRA